MKHIRYLDDNKTVCQVPKRLGYDFVILDSSATDTESCRTCSELLLAHNLRETDLEANRTWGVTYLPAEKSRTVARGLLTGLILSSLFWILVFVAFVEVFK